VDVREGGEKSPARPAAYLPPSMTGEETIFVPLRLAEAYPPVSHKSGDVVDASRDWRHRLFFWEVYCGHAGAVFAWDQTKAGHVPSAFLDGAGIADIEYFRNSGMGQSFWDDSNKLPFGTKPLGAHGVVLWVDSNYKPQLKALNPNTPSGILLYVRASDGALVYHVVRGEPKGTLLIRLTASAPHPNH
jgi:hypothetical protein